MRQEFDLPCALKWSDLEIARLMSYHHPNGDGSIGFSVFSRIIRMAISGEDARQWQKDAKEQEANSHHSPDDIYAALYHDVAAGCDGRLTHSNFLEAMAKLRFSLSPTEAVLFTDPRFAREKRAIPDTQFHYQFPDYSWCGPGPTAPSCPCPPAGSSAHPHAATHVTAHRAGMY